MIYDVQINGKDHRLDLERTDGHWKCSIDGRTLMVDALLPHRDVLSLLIAGKTYEVKREVSAAEVLLWVDGVRYAVEARDPRSLRARRSATANEAGPRKLLAPMPGKVVRVLAHAGQRVEAGESILVVEAMKMQNAIKSPKKGLLQKIVAAEGANVNAGDVLAIVE
jgi:biotin carboxyl carrier protein